jgi:hypothetical protein
MYRRPHAASSPAKAFKGKGRVLPSNSVIEAGKMRFSWEFMGNNGGLIWFNGIKIGTSLSEPSWIEHDWIGPIGAFFSLSENVDENTEYTSFDPMCLLLPLVGSVGHLFSFIGSHLIDHFGELKPVESWESSRVIPKDQLFWTGWVQAYGMSIKLLKDMGWCIWYIIWIYMALR